MGGGIALSLVLVLVMATGIVAMAAWLKKGETTLNTLTTGEATQLSLTGGAWQKNGADIAADDLAYPNDEYTITITLNKEDAAAAFFFIEKLTETDSLNADKYTVSYRFGASGEFVTTDIETGVEIGANTAVTVKVTIGDLDSATDAGKTVSLKAYLDVAAKTV